MAQKTFLPVNVSSLEYVWISSGILKIIKALHIFTYLEIEEEEKVLVEEETALEEIEDSFPEIEEKIV